MKSGANKRFEQFVNALSLTSKGDVHAIVSSGEEIHGDFNVVRLQYDGTMLGRLKAWLRIQLILSGMPAGVVVSDMLPPIPQKLSKHEVFQVVHDVRSHTEYGRWNSKNFAKIVQKIAWLLLNNFLVVSNQTKSQLAAIVGIKKNIVVSHNGVNLEIVKATKPSKNRAGFLYVADFDYRKNHQILIQAWKKIDPLIRPKLTLVGKHNSLRETIKKQIEAFDLGDSISILDPDFNEYELMRLYSVHEFYISPTLYEGFNMPLLEAASVNCKLIASDIPVHRELFEGHANFFKPSDPEQLAKIVCSPKELLVKPGHNLIEVFDWKVIASKFLETVQ